MSTPTDVKACIEKHLQAVRAHLSDKDEAVQNEILDGLRDHMNEALSRGEQPATVAAVEAIIAEMDDPSSYQEDLTLTGGPRRAQSPRASRNPWWYLAIAFLLINSLGVWKLIQIEQKSSTHSSNEPDASTGLAKVEVPHVASANTSGIHYPKSPTPTNPQENPPTKANTPEESHFRSVAFMENLNPVLQQSDQELSWLFDTAVVAPSGVGKPLTKDPIKFSPEIKGEFLWKESNKLFFKPAKPWCLNQSFTAELSTDFTTFNDQKYEGNRFWRFSTAGFELESFTQTPAHEAFHFNLIFSLPVNPTLLTEKLKFSYLTSNGEKIPLEYKLKTTYPNATIELETAIVPAISFVCEINPDLRPIKWDGGTHNQIERMLANAQLLTLSGATIEQHPGAKSTMTLTFSDDLNQTNPSDFIEITPKTNTTVTIADRSPAKLNITGDFVPGTVYEVKVKSGLHSNRGSVLPFNTTRNLLLPLNTTNTHSAGVEPKRPFDSVSFMNGKITEASSGTEELHWKFPYPVVDQTQVGKTLTENPIQFTPAKEGTFFWSTPNDLAFRPNTEWELNQLHEARLTKDLINLEGTHYAGVRYWTYNTPSMTIKKITQINGYDKGFKFSINFSLLPDSQSLHNQLKIFSYAANGTKNYLNFEIETDYYNSLVKNVHISSTPSNVIYFELQPGFRPGKWTQGIKEQIAFPVEISTVLTVNSVNQSGRHEKTPSIRVQFSEGVDIKTAAAFIEVSPSIKFTVERDSSDIHTLRLLGPFVPLRNYQVKIKAGLTSERGFVLVKEYNNSVTITRAAASLNFAGSGGYLSPAGNLLVPITYQNLSKFTVSVAPVMSNNLVYFTRNHSEDSTYNIPVDDTTATTRDDDDDHRYYNRSNQNISDVIGNATHKEIQIAGALNTECTEYVNLHDFTKTKGAYLVQIRSVDGENAESGQRSLSDSRLVVVTDLGISAKCSTSHVFVWVNSLKDAKPAGGVEVTTYSANNQLISKAVTNSDGVAAIPCDTRDKNKTPFLVTARLADDLSYLQLNHDPLDADLTESTRDYPSAGCEAFLFTDRGIFRPGETVHARTIIRNASFTAPTPFPVVFQIIKPDGRLFKELSAMPNLFGAAEIETVMPNYLPTGCYTIRLRVPQAKVDMGSKTFLLEDFVPPQIRVSVTTDAERVNASDALKAEIFAEHLFGSPAAGLKANIKCIYTPITFAPKQWSDYQFGTQSSPYWNRREETPFAMKPQDIDNLVLDDNGKAESEINTEIPKGATGPIQALVQASVFEQSGRAITSTKKATIDPYPFYIGIKRPSSSWWKSGETHQIQVVTVNPNGEVFKPEKPLSVTVSSINWNYNYKRNSNGSYDYECHKETTLLKEETLDLSTGSADYAFTPSGYGMIELSFTDPQSKTTSSFSFYTSSYEQSWSTTQREKPDSLILKLDKPEYRIGETAKLTIQAPFSGTALLTMETDKVLLSRVILLEKNTAEIDVEVKDAYAPNVHCTVSVIRPAVAESVWKGHRAFGSVPLKVSPRNHRINVVLENPQTILPQSKLKTKVLLKDDDGQPLDGEVTLIAVDEAICMLTSYKTPSPIDWLYALRKLSVETHDLYAELMEVMDDSVLTHPSHPSGDGGDDEAAAATERLTKRLNPIKANRFKPVSLWASTIQVTHGTATVDIDVPEFTGELRIMAIACNDQRMGSAQGMVKVKRPLIVQPSLPRFLAPGDTCQMNVTVFNEMGKDITAKLQVTCGGPLSAKFNEMNIELKKGASTSVSIPMVAGLLSGKALCTVICEADAVKFSDTIEIAVRPPISVEVIADSSSLAPGKTIELRTPSNWLPESASRRVQISKEPTLALGQGLQYLMRYPYGCIEQTTSGAFPLLYLPDLANKTFDKSMTKENVRDYVMSGVWRILSMQQADGEFSYWPGYNQPCSWGTIYATHFLIEAKKAGYDIPQDCLNRALKSLHSMLESASNENNQSTHNYDEMAYACYVLALAGEPDPSWLSRMLEMKDKLSYYARLMNATTLLVQGDPKRAVPILKELGLPGVGQRDHGGCFHSPNRNASLLLSAWLDIDPKNEDVIKLVQFLSKAKINGYWGTTQDNAMALMALGKYAQRIQGETHEFKGLITLPDGTSEPFNHTKDNLWHLEGNPSGSIALTNQGPGTLYYSYQSEGMPIDLMSYYQKITKNNNNGLIVTREWLDQEGKPIDIKKIKQNDLVVAKITLNPNGRLQENIVIEDLLPAGLEIENPNLDTTQSLPWIKSKSDWCIRQDIRDDRILLFSGALSNISTYYYLTRAVTPGTYMVPPVSAECMYDPEVRSINSQTEMTIQP